MADRVEAVAKFLEDEIPPAAPTDFHALARRVIEIADGDRPSFAPDTVVMNKALVIDSNGHGWWVDPHADTMKRASVG